MTAVLPAGANAAATPPPAPAAPTPTMQVVYEDAEVLFEWTRATPGAETVAVTFDPISVPPTEPAYAAHFLHRLGIDTLCVRKKREHFYQPLSRERFTALAEPVLARYRRRLAYGSSLGAYAVMYFCVHGYDTVIASSPRVSAHPRLGRPYWQERVPFEHVAFDAQQPASSGAVVFYDPHDEIDRLLVDEELRPAWPRARFLPVPYSGHPANQFLSEIGYISPFVQAVVAGRTPPVLNRRARKAGSFSYRFVLGAACLRHGKARWAEHLCRSALEQRPDIVSPQLTLGQALLAQGRFDEAEAPLRAFLERYPRDGDVLQALRQLEQARQRQPAAPTAPAPPPGPPPLPRWLSEARGRLRHQGTRLRQLARAVHLRARSVSPWLPSRLGLAVTRDDIAWCFRHLLGREPESEQVLLDHRECRRVADLVRAVMGSAEYRRRLGLPADAVPAERLVQLVAQARPLLADNGRVLEIGAARCLRFARRGDPTEACELVAPLFDLCLDTEPLPRPPQHQARLLDTASQALKPGGHLVWFAARGDAAHERPLPAGLVMVGERAVPGEPGLRMRLARRPA